MILHLRIRPSVIPASGHAQQVISYSVNYVRTRWRSLSPSIAHLGGDNVSSGQETVSVLTFSALEIRTHDMSLP